MGRYSPMDVYSGALRLAGTVDSVEATFTVEGGTLRVTSNDQEIGSWPIDAVTVTERIDGVHLDVEGEDLVVNMADLEAFQASMGVKKRRGLKTRTKPRAASQPSKPKVPASERLRTLFSWKTWRKRLRKPAVKWGLAFTAVIGLLLVALFATSTLGMLLMLVGMGMLILGALAVSDDPTAFQYLPSALTEKVLVSGGFVSLAIGLPLILLG